MGKDRSLLEKLISLWFFDTNEDYQIDLYKTCKNKYQQKMDYYLSKGYHPELSQRGANQYIAKELQKIANIR